MPASSSSASPSAKTAAWISERMQAMILAAGFGTRLLPHTLLRPKPLFPILNRPLLLLTVERLQNAGFDRIIVNCHHLGEQIVDLLHGMAGVTVLLEETILGTGGGLRGALPYLHDAPLLVTNGDIYHDFDFAHLYAGHELRGDRVSLAVHDCPRFNNVRVEAGRGVTAFGTSGQDCLAFTGLHVIDPEILEEIAPGRYSCILDRYRQLLALGEKIAAVRVTGYWTDMGTPADYLALHGGLLTGAIPRWREIGGEEETAFRCGPGTRMEAKPEWEDWCCLGDVELGADVHLARVVAWDGVRIASGCRLADVLLSA